MALLVGSLVVFAVVIALTRFEGEMPLLELDDQPVQAIGASHTLKGLASDQKTGLRRVWIAVIQNGKERVLTLSFMTGQVWTFKNQLHLMVLQQATSWVGRTQVMP